MLYLPQWLFMQVAKTLIRLQKCVAWSGLSQFTYTERTIVAGWIFVNKNKTSDNLLSSNINADWACFYTLPLSFGGILWHHIGCPYVWLVFFFFLVNKTWCNCQWSFTKLGMCIDIVEIWFWIIYGQICQFFGRVFLKKNSSFKIAMSGQASSEVYLLVNLFSKLYFTFISSPELCSGWAIVITFRLSVRASVRWHFQVTSPLKPLSQFCSNFIWSLLRVGERKIAKMAAVRWPRWLPRPYLVKTFKNLLLQNRECLGAEPLQESSGTGGLPKLLKELSYIDVWPF